MKKALDYFLSVIYLTYFGTLLCIFHVIQWVAYEFFGQSAHQKIVVVLNYFIVKGWILTGSTSNFEIKTPFEAGKTYLFVSNHQSMFDIPGIIWYLRKYTPLFISKIELSKGIPSISYNLRVGKAALIDRKDPKQAISEILKFSNYIKENNFSGVIFPEGTRSRTGKLKPFSVGGLATLIKKNPNADIVPIAIKNTGLFNPTGLFPLRSFTHMTWTTLDLISSKGKTAEEVCKLVETNIGEFLNDNQI